MKFVTSHFDLPKQSLEHLLLIEFNHLIHIERHSWLVFEVLDFEFDLTQLLDDFPSLAHFEVFFVLPKLPLLFDFPLYFCHLSSHMFEWVDIRLHSLPYIFNQLVCCLCDTFFERVESHLDQLLLLGLFVRRSSQVREFRV